MRLRTLTPVAALAALALLAAACTAGDTTVTVAQPQQTGISVSGTGSVTVVPDLAVLSLGVEVTRPTVAEAQSAAAEAMEAVRAALGRDGVEERDVATQHFNIFPQYSRPAPCVETRLAPVPAPAPLNATEDATEGARAPLVVPAVASTPCPPQEPRITGFRVNNQLTVKVRDLDRLSDVLDGAIAAGGDTVRVNNVSFSVDEPEQYLGEAREQAMQDARERAEQLASLAGVTLGQVRSVSESSAPSPIFGRGGFAVNDFAMAEAAPTPLSPGETEVSLTVFVVYEIE